MATAKKQQPITERLNSYEDACALLGKEPLTIEHYNFLPEDERQAEYSLHRIKRGIEAINEGHVFDWNSYDEDKWFPVWDVETYGNNEPGSGFALYVVLYVSTFTLVGARLVTRSEADMRHICKIFFEDYRNWIKK